MRDFVEDVDCSLQYKIIPITDVYGPTKEDPTYEMIVVSEETKKGGEMINKKRIENNLSCLKIHVVKLVLDPKTELHEESKISSSNQRIRLLGTRLRQPVRANKYFKLIRQKLTQL